MATNLIAFIVFFIHRNSEIPFREDSRFWVPLRDYSIYLPTTWTKNMAANSIVKSSMRMLGSCARASSGMKTSRPVSAMLTSQRRQKHHATGTANPLMPRVPSRQQMTFSAEQPGHEIEIEQRPRIVDMRQGDKVRSHKNGLSQWEKALNIMFYKWLHITVNCEI